MKQNDTKFHALYLMLDSEDDWAFDGSKKELLAAVKELYEDNKELISDRDEQGKYGIEYSTIHDDSFHYDRHTKFFESKTKRDNVFDDWENKRHWCKIFDENLEYPTPSPNFSRSFKVFREGDEIYTEKELGQTK